MRLVRPLIKRALMRLGYDLRPIHTFEDAASLIHRLLPHAATVFDIGANVGQSVALFRSLYPSACIHAFEPDPIAAQSLRERVNEDGRTMLNQVAVGERTGTIRFSRYGQSEMNSVLPPDSGNWTTVTDTVEAPITTIDAYCAERGIGAIDVLKTDTQGYDLPVLRGAAAMLATVKLIKVELIFAPLYDGQSDPLVVMSWLFERGFRVGAFCEQAEFRGALGWMDGLFIRAPAK